MIKKLLIDAIDGIYKAFDWKESAEGLDYWVDVTNKLEDKLQITIKKEQENLKQLYDENVKSGVFK